MEGADEPEESNLTTTLNPGSNSSLQKLETESAASSKHTASSPSRLTGRGGVNCRQRAADIDGLWAWVVTGSTFVIHFILYGFIFVMGMYFVVFLKTFKRSSSETAWIASLYLGTLCATGPIAGVLINKWGTRVTLLLGSVASTTGQVSSAFLVDLRPLYFTFGLLTGFGHGCFLMSCVVALNQYFRKYRVLALGISLVGTALGNIVYPYLTRYLIDNHGWRGALIMSGGINLQCCVAAMFVRPLPKSAIDQGKNEDKKSATQPSSKSLCETTAALLSDLHYWLLCLSNVTFVFGISVFITHIAAFAQSVGLGPGRTDHLLSSLGIASLVGRGLTALVAQHQRVNIILFLVFCYVISGLAMICYGLNSTFLGLILSVLIYGLFSSTNGSVSAEYASFVIGTDSFATGYGYVMFCNGIGAVGGAPVAGLLYDLTKIYPASFYLSGSFMVLSGLLMIPTFLAYRNKGNKFKHPADTAIQLADVDHNKLVNGETEKLSDACDA